MSLNYNSVWILLIVENWKYCSRIIFKYMNSVMGPVLIKKLIKKVLMGPVND